MRIWKALQRQLGLNENKNLLHPDASYMLEVEPTFLAALEEAIAAPEPHDLRIDRLAEGAADLFVERLYSLNQFLQVSAEAKDSLKNIYLQTWRKMIETRDVERVLRTYHYPLLSDWAGALYPESFKAALASRPKVGSVVCQDYSAALQIALLRLHFPLREPLLDIGCGRNAHLVTYLRGLGVEAHGLDRYLRQKKSYLMQDNWLETEFRPDRWGTIVSHMAFTNHFAYVEKFDTCQVPLYLTKYVEILGSLKAGGVFVYSPSCSTLESIVDARTFVIEKQSIGNGYQVTKVNRGAP